ncbi:MAG: metallophosphoesterase, partial [archaeon GB-1867-035]|nr:metallophosphoesterase [Candidatus Culexmicrobium profundum]
MKIHGRLLPLLCLLLMVSLTFNNIVNARGMILYGEAIRPVREVVWDPLPSKPKLAVLGSMMNIRVLADESASDWRILLTSEYGSFKVEIVNSSYNVKDKLWDVTVRIPREIPTGLYNLEVHFTSNAKGEVEYLQYKCVNVSKSMPHELLIAHITDTHLPYGADVLARAIYELTLIRPSLVIITGDLVDVDTIASAWKQAQSILFRGLIKSPIYILPGNHDHTGDNASNYQTYCGPLYYYEQLGNFHLIALDTSYEGFINFGQLNWAKSVLSEITDSVKILVFHHPLFSWGPSSLNGSWSQIEQFQKYLYSSWKGNIDSAKRLLQLIEEYNVTLILSGHIHAEHYVIYNNYHHFEVNLPAGGGLREGDYWSFRLIKIDENGNVKLFAHGNKSPTSHPSSYPLGMITYYYTPFNDGSSNAVSIYIMNNLSSPITPLIEFIVNSDKPLDQYFFYPESPSEYEVFSIGNAYVFRF